jgi:tRNA threonylcarbamoyl adenosine modification protein YeaZ
VLPGQGWLSRDLADQLAVVGRLGWATVLLLAFDTATPAVTVAVHDGTRVVAQASAVDARRHGELLAASISSVLRAAGACRTDLTAVAVGTGPGPYTGLRAGLVTAAVLASALSIRLDGICTLDVIAAQAAAGHVEGEDGFLVATDARRREVYWARYSPSGERACGPQVGMPGELPGDLPIAGEGALIYPELAGRSIEPGFPSAATLADMAARRFAGGEPPLPAEPLYLRRPDAREPGPRKRVTP